jgi:hypothetical protein
MSRIILLCLILPLLAGCQPRKTGLFSSLESSGGGVVNGYEIFIVKGNRISGIESDYFAIVQCAKGKISPPVIGKVVMNLDELVITLPEQTGLGCPSSLFTGRVGFKELIGSFGDGEQLSLPRKDSFWE